MWVGERGRGQSMGVNVHAGVYMGVGVDVGGVWGVGLFPETFAMARQNTEARLVLQLCVLHITRARARTHTHHIATKQGHGPLSRAAWVWCCM